MTFRILVRTHKQALKHTALWQELAEVEAVGLAHALTRLQRDYEAGEYLLVSNEDWASTEVTIPASVAA